MTTTAEPELGSSPETPTGDAVLSWLSQTRIGLGGLVEGGGSVSDAVRIDRIRELEQIAAAVKAVQAAEMVKFGQSQVAEQQTAGVDYRRLGRGIADQIALACRVSPSEGSRRLGLARALWFDLPRTYAALTEGGINDYTAHLVDKETSHLDGATRRAVDADLHAADLTGKAPREIGLLARRLAQQADPAGAVKRARKARKDRRVSLRAAPDTMALLSGLLPLEQGVACWASLKSAADRLVGVGDQRSRGQIMADTLVERITGQARADEVPLDVQITVPVESLLDSDSPDGAAPADGGFPAAGRTVVGGDRRRRRFTGWLAGLITARDRTCRDPYCTAPIRHLDHIHRYADGGPTTLDNGRGVCERGNHVREMPGWTVAVIDDGRSGAAHTTITTTPTGHCYLSRAPQPP